MTADSQKLRIKAQRISQAIVNDIIKACSIACIMKEPPMVLQLGMLTYSLGLQDEATFVDDFVVEPKPLQNGVVAV